MTPIARRDKRDVLCPQCRGLVRRRACPVCHTALPVDFVGSKSPVIGLVGARNSGKTVLMTVLVKQLRGVVARRFGANIRIVNDNPDGFQGIDQYQSGREAALYDEHQLPPATEQLGSAGRKNASPLVVRWQCEAPRLFGGTTLRSTVLSFVDTAGEDLADQETTFTLQYIAVCDALVITLDPFAIPGARAKLNLPEGAVQVDEDVPQDVIGRITELLRTEHGVKARRRIKLPVAIVFTKMDAFYGDLDRNIPLMAKADARPLYDEMDGQAVHEHMRALLDEWGAGEIDNHMRLNYSDFRYFGVSALGAEPDYTSFAVAPGGVRPHRVEDPVLWLLSKAGTVASA